MKILLVRPYYYIGKEDCPYEFKEPLGLEYIAAYIRNDCDVEIFDMIGSYWQKYEKCKWDPSLMKIGGSLKDLFSKIEEVKPDVIGITSIFLMEINTLLELTKAVKSNYPEIKIVVGGSNPSCLGEKFLIRNPYIDLFIIGEGEETFRELVLKKFKKLDEIKGIIFRDKKGNILRTNRRPPININTIPFPARDLVPYRNYNKTIKYQGLRTRFGQKITLGVMSLISNTFIDDILDRLMGSLIKRFARTSISFPSATISTSRGCPNQCTFCSIHAIWGNEYRIRTAKNVIDEITLLYEKYGIRHISILDDNFTISKKRTIQICKEIVRRKLNLTLEALSGVYAPTLDKEVLTWLKRAGLNFMYLGIESGNQKILDNVVKKNLDLHKITEVIEICKSLDIKTGGYFIIGFPGETIENMKETINYALKSKLDRARLYLLQPFPGSPLYEKLIRDRMLTKDYDYAKTNVFKGKFYIKTPEFNPAEVEKLAIEGRRLLFKAGKLSRSGGFFNK